MLNTAVCLADGRTDIIAIPSFLVIVEPASCSKDEWQELCVLVHALDDHDMKVLLAQPSQHRKKLPSYNVIKTPARLDATFLKFLMLSRRAKVARQRAIHQKTERRMLRLMYMLRQLETYQPLRVQGVAQELMASDRCCAS